MKTKAKQIAQIHDNQLFAPKKDQINKLYFGK